ncbi:alkyl hydroperoxide reductase AhpD [Pseudoalteromonas sp. A25]|uniref:carboxymuconolactone decarboxylase family protein n=1 Tax=Pseudoalteromonas sp. A25 TaxID=116092 RepID=UPI0012609801|nr:carboxymuconolactone decarboxylase family protein [Pseudoalteromonas sp. A25]BBN83764.1 alkyl hydroperoxide reductase AhpD [Pseudoalteromonas sp. A25]
MTMRLNYIEAAPGAMDILLTQERYLKEQFAASKTLSLTILELIKLRISQINQCAFCINMHTKEAIAQGEKPQRIISLNAWRDMPIYNTVERCALAWAEQQIQQVPITLQDVETALETFNEQDLVNLTVAVNAINSWNKFAKAFNPSI